MKTLFFKWAAFSLLAAPWLTAHAVVFTNDTLLSPLNDAYEGQAVVVSNCVLTADGPHGFASVRVAGTGTLTHSAAANGLANVNDFVYDEPQILTGTNPATLLMSNVVAASALVRDASGTITYTKTLDYTLGATNEFTTLQRTLTSSIPDGAFVLVTYEYPTGTTNSGLSLVVTGDLEVEPGASINVNGRGYSSGFGSGPGNSGGSPASGGGGGHGGYGGLSSSNAYGGLVYDDTFHPMDKGGGGGSGVGGIGGAGGGAIALTVGGRAKFNGAISANGANGTNTRSGGGAGGSIWLTAQTITGAGSLSADGGAGEPIHGGGGGGGRIALYFATNVFSGTVVARGGSGFVGGGAGTIYRQATDLSQNLVTVDNGGRSGTNTLLQVTNGADLTITGAASAVPSGSQTIGNLLMTAAARLAAAGSQQTVTIVASNSTVQAGASIVLDGAGYAARAGSGFGGTYTSGSYTWGNGAGHGGYGGGSSNSSATPIGGYYGIVPSPTTLGSGGGGLLSGTNLGGAGGGVLRLTISGALLLDGKISANGSSAVGPGGGGGSGGSLWLTVGSISGSGSLFANGGSGSNPYGGGGAGGRIALEFSTNLFAGTIAAYGGSGTNWGGAGTVYLKPSTQNGTLIVANGNHSGTNTPFSVSGTYSLSVTGGAQAQLTGSQTLSSLLVGSNSSVLAAYPTTLTLTVNGDAQVQPGGSISTDGLGYPAYQGTGFGRYYNTGTNYYSGGASHAGYGASGGNPLAYAGVTYGLITAPTTFGSGGGGYYNGYDQYNYGYSGGAGGGCIRLTVNGALKLNGRLSADATSYRLWAGGGGSGGSVWLTVAQLSGSGRISANGGNGNAPNGGGGGGGRIAIQYNAAQTNAFAGTITAAGGSGTSWGGAGTIYTLPYGQTQQLLLDNGGFAGTNTPVSVSGSYGLTMKGGAWGTLSGSQTFTSLLIGSNATLVGPAYPFLYTYTVSGNATIESGGRLQADGLGYPLNSGNGFGRYYYYVGIYYGGGGGYGGSGGYGGYLSASGGLGYGSALLPNSFGSGGGGYPPGATTGGSGGGYVGLNVSGTLLLNGVISARGLGGFVSGTGGGSGGAISLNIGTFSGSGSISVNGGDGSDSTGGGGGGGRIAVFYTSNLFTGSLTAYGGKGFRNGGAGTIYLRANNQNSGQVSMDNGGTTGTNSPFFDSSSYALSISGGAMGWPSSSSSIGSLTVASNGWLMMSSAPLTVTGNATIQAGGGVTADGTGSIGGTGTGAGANSGTVKGGGGHGGYGAANFTSGGGAYDSLLFPTQAGSGGGNGSGTSAAPYGGSGGGIARLTVNQTLTVNGRISADGLAGDVNSGGGSGGSVLLTVGSLIGNGSISANGGSGNGSAGGGGGGRVAVIYTSASPAGSFTGAISASGGSGNGRGGAGTIYVKSSAASVGRLVIDNGGLSGTNTPLSSGFGLPSSPFDLTLQGGATAHFTATPPILSNLVVASSSLLTTLPSQTNLELAVLRNVSVASDSAIAVDGKGYAQGAGPGAGATLSGQGGGGGYGGAGGASASGALGGTNYGFITQPVDRGSGGGAGSYTYYGGSQGGGAIRLTVGGTLDLEGRLGANGTSGLQDDSGGGSGGSLWLTAGALTGNGSINADGGWGELFNGGAGGGGRIALYSPANTFTGLVSAAAGVGAWPASDGTIFLASSIGALTVVSQAPIGIVSNGVTSVDLTFSTPVNPYSVAASDFIVQTPVGVLPQANLTVSALSPSILRVNFPLQTTVGDYSVQAGPQIEDLFGHPMVQAYVGRFSVMLPQIQGTITNAVGQPVAGVTIQPTSGASLATSDASGRYTIGVLNGWTGSVTPSFAGFMFVPGSRSFTSVAANVIEQDFLMVSIPALATGLAGTNVAIRWPGIEGVTYQVFWSSNLAGWVPYASPAPGSNGLMELLVPTNSYPQRFFRLRATD